jgi:imidazolonepropionase-like amidohydrolase
MKPLLFGFGVLLASLNPLGAQDSSWALTHAAVIDVAGARVLLDQTIVINGERIEAVASARSITLLPRTRTQDATGRFVIPGLYDMHAHAFLAGESPAMEFARRTREGVLGIRDMGAPLDAVRQLPKSPSGDWPLLPRIWFSGPILDGPRHLGLEFRRIVPDAAAAREAVEDLTAAGVHFIKVHDFLSSSAYAEVIRQARARHIPVAGHIPAAISAEDAADAGQRSVEHLGGLTHAVLRSCSRAPAGGGLEFLRRAANDESAAYRYVMSSAFITPLLDGFDEERCAVLARQFRQKHVSQVPTLVLFEPVSRREVDPEASTAVATEDRSARTALFRTQLRIVGIMHKAGVPILPGLDGIPGVTIHDELRLLVEAGLSPAEALRSATFDSAQYLGVSDSHGRIAPGQFADFLVLAANPLLDIANTRHIVGVVLRGQYLDSQH